MCCVATARRRVAPAGATSGVDQIGVAERTRNSRTSQRSWGRAPRSFEARSAVEPVSPAATAGSSPLLNYLALLGWSIADDHDSAPSLDEMVAAFDVLPTSTPALARNSTRRRPTRWNAEHIRCFDVGDFTVRRPFG